MSQEDTVPRGPIEAMERGPGPARYQLPPAIGVPNHDPRKWKAPAYSLTGGAKPFKGTGVPGPNHYGVNPETTRKGKDGVPKYSLASRNKDLKKDNFPASNSYKTENVWPQGETKRPSYSMSSRTRYTQKENVPAPNRYSLPVLIGPKITVSNKRGGPSYTMSERSNIRGFSEDLAKTPGPARYGSTENNIYLKKNPQYTLQGRSKLPKDGTKKPGPGAHKPEAVSIHKRSAPAYSLGKRHSNFMRILMV